MTFEEYQRESRKTAIYPAKGYGPEYVILGLVGESGEIAEKMKKILRDKDGVVDEETKQAFAKELGDVLWYMAQLATDFGISLEAVARVNLEKTQSRQQRGTLHGTGDNR